MYKNKISMSLSLFFFYFDFILFACLCLIFLFVCLFRKKKLLKIKNNDEVKKLQSPFHKLPKTLIKEKTRQDILIMKNYF